MRFVSGILLFLLSDPVDRGSWDYFAGSCGYWTLNIYFVVVDILWMLDLQSLFYRGILEILDPTFLFHRGTLEILDLNFLFWGGGT